MPVVKLSPEPQSFQENLAESILQVVQMICNILFKGPLSEYTVMILRIFSRATGPISIKYKQVYDIPVLGKRGFKFVWIKGCSYFKGELIITF